MPAAHLARERRHRQRPGRQRPQGGQLALAEAGPPSSAAARPASVSSACSELRGRQRAAGARAGAGREHQREPARRRRAVLAGQPEAEAHERGGHVGLQRAQRLGEPLGRQVALLGEVHHHAEQAPRPEGHHEHAAHRHARQVAAQPVVERAAQRAGRGQRLDLGDHASNLRGGPDAGGRAGTVWTCAPWHEDFEALGLLDDVPGRARARGAPGAAAGAARGGRAGRRAAPRRGPQPARAAAGGAGALRGERALHAGGGGRALRPRARVPRAAEPGAGRAAPGARGARVRRERRAPGQRTCARSGRPACPDDGILEIARVLGMGAANLAATRGHRLRLGLPPRRRHRVRPLGPLRRGDARAAAPARAGPAVRRCACTSAR